MPERYPIYDGKVGFEQAYEELGEVFADQYPVDATWADPYMDYQSGRVTLRITSEPPAIIKETSYFTRIGEQLVRDTTTDTITMDASGDQVVVTRQEMKQDRTLQEDGTYPKRWSGSEEPITLNGLARRVTFRRTMRLTDEVVNVPREVDEQAGDGKRP